MTQIYSRLIGTGSHLPEQVLSNADLEKIVDTSDEWIRERTGIAQRHVAADGETTCDLAEHAARRALDAAGLKPSDIDFLIVGTTTPDIVFPATACLLQARLGMSGIPAMDVNAACSGFIYALGVADKFVKSGSHKRALVVGAETLTRILDWSDRTTAVLFGDGAGAAVIEASDQPGILSTHLHADGAHADLLCSPRGVSTGFTAEERGGVHVKMQGREVFKVAVRSLGQIVEETLQANDMTDADIDWLIPHQANLRIISATAKKLKMSMDRVIVTVDQHGNTSAASVPLALDQAIRSGQVKPGEVLLLEAFGGGFTWGSALIKY